jgi:hypothetical protein
MKGAMSAKVDELVLKNQLFTIHPDVTEANWISKDLQTETVFKEIVIQHPNSGKNVIVISVGNLKENRSYLWNIGKF